MPNILAVTTSLGTKWESYSQTLLSLNIPEWRRVVVDGRKNWSPTMFIESVIKFDVDYIVHIDEDCFVWSRDALYELVEVLEKDHSISAVGIPDGGHYYRDHNPAALNLFFVIFRAETLKKSWSDRVNWGKYFFKEKYADEVIQQKKVFDKERVNWNEGEPYYPLFWSMLSGGGRFLYLDEELDSSRWSSKVISPTGKVTVEHMWYLRQWFSSEIMPGHDCPNSERYRSIENDILKKYKFSLRFWLILLYMHVKRIARRMIK